MFSRLTSWSNNLMERYLPDPYLFVLILTLVVFGMALIITPTPAQDLVMMWGNGFWGLLTFSMQMVLILVTGYVLASSRVFKYVLSSLAQISKSPAGAVVNVTIVSLAASWINWGFGLVIGALFAKELARHIRGVDYRLLIASAYSGFIVWHGGLAGSVPLTIATPDHFSQDLIGIIPTSETIFAPFNLVIVGAMFIVLPVINRMMFNQEKAVTIDPETLKDEPIAEEKPEADMTPAERLENSWMLSVIFGLVIGPAFIIGYFYQNGFQLNLNIVNFTFLFLGILFHFRPKYFLHAVRNAVKGAGGIIIQFPFYAGIMGLMIDSGLAAAIAEWFVSFSNEVTYPLFTFLSAGLINFFVPSGGGQWAVQAPIMLEAGAALGVDPAKTAMAVAWGDAWTNLIQPFWALPALAIAGLKARDIMGFCLIHLFITGVMIALGLILL
ncbi:short-chain fatty acids transporter [Melghiribacillus thermohalophilus]|uniref:Short-chain fatty acids transporter n=1 Tax=Melghiribacillus thermohalophilus TaxID=1324956 RepID=A0A4R3N2P7_9BACI|nr:short-chain fatty acid transporter [Melghiribacillus thermohalophilus]TCT20949.1 short-chain fatty acids transporter [Melghiribacillus thermohalophilus]